ncbi:MAG: DUF1015 family protein [Bacteroidales bacterium]|jgi:uncharacterized protein (DUF1015 family)|nr:DUF1015 family protein [Bacteroidales bacterium]
MAILKPFKGLRPPTDIVEKVASRPYDVLNTEEARKEAAGNPQSLLHITKAEIDLPVGTDEHSEEVYNKVVENFNMFQTKGWLLQDADEKYYVYAQTMNGRTQYGIMGTAHIDDYFNNNIKKHELTRKDKEEDRMIHVRITNANVEPVFFSYPANTEIDKIVSEVITHEPVYNFVTDDNFGHHFWIIDDKATINRITEIFKNDIPYLYVADGHHRTAAAALVGQEKRKKNPNHTGKEEYNYFMAVVFPDNQLKIIDYNRVVKNLNGLSQAEFMSKLEQSFTIEKKGTEIYKPEKLHEFSMYIDHHWYKLTAKAGTFNDADPIEVLDVTILSNLVLDKLLGIKDLRTSKDIDFVGGIRGLGELKRRVDSGEMAAAFALYPVSMQQLINIADTGNIMPPKTTWFEPKLRSGLAIHVLE